MNKYPLKSFPLSERKLRVAHIVPHIDQEAAGPSYSVPRLCQSHSAAGDEVELLCLAAQGPVDGIRMYLYPQWPIFKKFSISTSLSRALWKKAPVLDIVHNHSLWSMVNVAAGWIVPGRGAKLVTSPRGTLSEWALRRSALKKFVLWPLQKRVLFRADLLHATSEEEYRQIRIQGVTAPVAVIPNGIDIPPYKKNFNVSSEVSEIRTLLFLSRIHPTKGLDRLLRSWRILQARYPNWRLKIVGHGEAEHIRELKDLVFELGVERVEYCGPIYGEAKSTVYWESDLFVLPTHSENFGMAVAEALAHGCPAIVGTGAPWAGLEREGCGWWINNDVETLAATLEKAMALPLNVLVKMGQRGRNWMAHEYGWTQIGREMAVVYKWLLTGGDKPECVRLE